MENLSKGLGLFLGGIALIIFAAILLAWPVQLLWNHSLVGAVDGVHPIGFWQAMGINFLFSILFKASTTSNKK
jgi:hypothetical protein